jgi:hypothetical protein
VNGGGEIKSQIDSPRHQEDARVLHRLVATNWIRTALWTAKGVLLGWIYV